MASTSLTKTVQKVGSDAITKMTFSAWIKRSKLGEGQIFNAYQLSSYYTRIYFNGSDALAIYSYINSSQQVFIKTNRLFRDTNAWYHLVVSVDTTQATASDRVKIYINGVQETSFASGAEVYPSQNSGFGQFNDTGATLYIGSSPSATNFDGSMSHINYTPYTAYDASAFGSTDATTGEWKINTSPSVTYSTAGFFILKDGNSVTDQSGNSNNFTVGGGTLTKTEDSPSNVFATGNPLYYYNGAYASWSNGNNTCYTNSGATGVNRATLGASSGKYYWEVKIGASDGAGNIWQGVGIVGDDVTSHTDELGNTTFQIGYWGEDGTIRKNNYTNVTTGTTFTTNDIIGVALDLDNGKIYFHKNGTYVNTVSGYQGNPNTGQYGFSLPDLTSSPPPLGFYFPAWGDWDNNNRYYFYLNFGNGYFGTTAVSSAGTNASNNGIFEYDVPTGYTALSTKGLNL